MARRGVHHAKDGGSGRKEKPGGIQLPMEISFITVNKPGQRIPYSQLSQITAHAMRKSHERRRDLENITTKQGRQPQQAAWNTSYSDQSQVDGSWDSSHSNKKRQRLQMGVFSQQEGVTKMVPRKTEEPPAVLVDGIHSEAQSPSEDSSSRVIPNHRPLTQPCDCFHCRILALVRPSAHSDMVFGGTRSDPFLRYPIPFQTYFPAVVDHCKEVIAPDAAFFKLVVTHDVLFEAILSWVLYTTLAHTPELKKAALLHYGATLVKVRKGLLSRGPKRRAVMAAISNLGGVCAYLGDDTSFNMHRNALQYLAEFNVTEDLPKLDIIPRRPSKLHDALSSAQPWPNTGESPFLEDDFIKSQRSIQTAAEPIYSRFSLTTNVSKHLSMLPEGFRELALKGIISVQVIERVGMNRSQIVCLASRATMDRENSKVLRQRFTPLDHLIWMGFSVFHLCTATYRADREELAETFIECSQKMISGSKEENECLLWGGCIVVTTQALENWELPQRQEVLDILLSRFKMSTSEMTTIAQKFLWNESMSTSLTAVMEQRLVVVPKIEEGAEWPIFL